MKRLLGGYTIVEVMLFLAISGVLFVAATITFGGQQDKTAFEQGIKDFTSQLQKSVDEVSTSVFPAGNYTCQKDIITTPARPAPVLKNTTSSQGTNQDCIFLGRAFQVVPTQQKIFIYGVLGIKSNALGEPITSFANANPTPAFATGMDLTEEYSFSWGKVISSKVVQSGTTTSTDSDIIGFYNSLQDGAQASGVSGAQSVFAKGYNFVSSDINTARSASVQSCIQETSVACANTPTISSWALCFANSKTSQTALITVTSNPTGITTDTVIGGC